jgi:hypothetical protein
LRHKPKRFLASSKVRALKLSIFLFRAPRNPNPTRISQTLPFTLENPRTHDLPFSYTSLGFVGIKTEAFLLLSHGFSLNSHILSVSFGLSFFPYHNQELEDQNVTFFSSTNHQGAKDSTFPSQKALASKNVRLFNFSHSLLL